MEEKKYLVLWNYGEVHGTTPIDMVVFGNDSAESTTKRITSKIRDVNNFDEDSYLRITGIFQL